MKATGSDMLVLDVCEDAEICGEYTIVRTIAYTRLRDSVVDRIAWVNLKDAQRGDECCLCYNGTIEIVGDEARCAGECGSVAKRQETA